MREPPASRPLCAICGWAMVPCDEPADGHRQVVCVNAECLEFGVHKSLTGS